MRRENRKAFTFIELLATIVVTLVAILGSVSLFNRGTALVSSIKEDLAANYAIQEQMELIRRTKFDDLLIAYPIGNTAFTTTSFSLLSNPTGQVIVDYPFSSTDIVRTTVNVSWTTASGRVKTKTAVTFVCDGGLGG